MMRDKYFWLALGLLLVVSTSLIAIGGLGWLLWVNIA